MSRYTPPTDDEISRQMLGYSDEAIKSRYDRLQKIPFIGPVLGALEDLAGPEFDLIIKAGQEVKDVVDASKTVFNKAKSAIDWLENKRDNHRADGGNDASIHSVSFIPTFQSNTGHSVPHFNHAASIAYAGSNANMYQTG
jgi:hypothetical protein